jgi:hypothetical protein
MRKKRIRIERVKREREGRHRNYPKVSENLDGLKLSFYRTYGKIPTESELKQYSDYMIMKSFEDDEEDDEEELESNFI